MTTLKKDENFISDLAVVSDYGGKVSPGDFAVKFHPYKFLNFISPLNLKYKHKQFEKLNLANKYGDTTESELEKVVQ